MGFLGLAIGPARFGTRLSDLGSFKTELDSSGPFWSNDWVVFCVGVGDEEGDTRREFLEALGA